MFGSDVQSLARWGSKAYDLAFWGSNRRSCIPRSKSVATIMIIRLSLANNLFWSYAGLLQFSAFDSKGGMDEAGLKSLLSLFALDFENWVWEKVTERNGI